MTDTLFTPITINTLEIENRIYLPAMHLGMAKDFEVTDQIVNFYTQRAKGGPGMICVGYATVDELSGNTQNIGAHADRFIPGLTRLASAIKENGSLAAVQINHAGRYNFSFFIDGKQSVAPSAIASRMTKETPKAMSVEEIKQTIVAFAAAAVRVQKAGFDAVEVLSGTGYLISEFLSPLTNQRTDEYGGSLENRMRFGLEIIAAIREAVGEKFPLMVRMNGNDFMPGGNPRHELIAYARALAKVGVDALCVNVGWHEARVPMIVAQVPRGAFAYLARGIKEVVDIPVIASHRINDPKEAREVIKEGYCDMVAMGRSLIADPMLPQKARQGKENQIVHCIACAQGCFDNLFKLKHVECLCNPLAGYEQEGENAPVVPGGASCKKVLVVGGGAAGMTAALTAARRGHLVTLYESCDRLGGQLHLAAAPPGRQEFAQFARDLEAQMVALKIPVVLNTVVDKSLIAAMAPDVVLLATGAIPLLPPIPGLELPHVVDAWDVLTNKVDTGKRVAIIGGGAVGVETALFLAEKGTLSADTLKFLFVNKAETPETLFEMVTKGSKEICVVEMMDRVGKDIGKSTKWGMMQDLGRFGVTTITAGRVTKIIETGIEYVETPGAENTGGATRQIEVDTVVVAAGSASHNPLEEMVKQMGMVFQVIGDAGKVGTAFDAVHAGYRAAREI